MKKIVIIGAGGHAKVVADIILRRIKFLNEDIKIMGFLDDKYSETLTNEDYIFNIPILGKVDLINEILDDDIYFIIAIGNNTTRERISKKYNLNYYTAIHPDAVVGFQVSLGSGAVVMANATINSGSTIGKHCIINTGSIIEHDNCIEDYSHISPGVKLAGGVKVGTRSWIGLGSNIIQEITIGSDTIIGAGSVVVTDIGKNKKAYGVPCKEIDI